MANHESSTTETSSAMYQAMLDPCHKRFSWLSTDIQQDPSAMFAARVTDIGRGARVLASVLRQHLVDLGAIASGAGGSVQQLFSDDDVNDLAALLEISLDTLCEAADRRLDCITNPALGSVKA